MTLMLEAPAEADSWATLDTPPPAPGTELAVLHNQLLSLRPYHRLAVCCSCQPDVALGVLDLDDWSATLVNGLRSQHLAFVAVRDALAHEAVAAP